MIKAAGIGYSGIHKLKTHAFSCLLRPHTQTDFHHFLSLLLMKTEFIEAFQHPAVIGNRKPVINGSFDFLHTLLPVFSGML